DSGISAIVGPNGCGKTNIVDAIRWVLGEQRYSALRSDKMEDVIFNGTKTRKALGMAEASLVIENTKGILPSEYTQVTIGRRVYRSGESEYLLNKVPCRLKDILDLFMDTGMGADAYSVIELKMIETILSDKTDERRRLFEEAAGVTKYKHRRKAAYRKLESVQDDLVRVNDIVAEVQKAVSTLERQARRAEQFNDVKAKLRMLEIDLMEREYAQLVGRSAPIEEKLRLLNDDRSKIDVDLSGEESRLEALRGRMLESEKRLAEAQRDVSLQRESMHRVEESNAVAAERIKALRGNGARLENEQAELRLTLARLEEERTALEAAIADLRTRETAAEAELLARKTALAECESRLDAAKENLRLLNDRTISLVEKAAERQTEQDRRKGRAESLNGRSSHAEEEIAAYEQDMARLDGVIADLTASDRQVRRKFTELEMAYYQAESRRKELAGEIDRLRAREADLQNELGRKSARVDFLKGLVESREGLPEGVRYLSSSAAWKPSRNITVADAVHAEERYRAAVEAALGEYAGLLVVENSAEAERGIALLKAEERGKAMFVCLDRLPEIRSSVKLPAIPGVVGLASNVAKCDGAYASLFRLILDRVVIVEDARAAAEVTRRIPGVRCVTLEGEIRTGVGIRRGGSRRQDEGGLIGKREQIEELQRDIASLREQLRASEEERNAVVAAHDAIDLKSQNEAVKVVEKEMNGIEMRIAQVAFEKNRAADIIAKNREEIHSLASEVAELESQIALDAPALGALAEEKVEAERAIGAATSQMEVLEGEWNGRSREVNEGEIALVTLRGEIQNAAENLERIGASAAEALLQISRKEEEKQSGARAVAADEESVAESTRTLEGLREVLGVVSARREAVEQETAGIRDEIHSIELAIKDRRRTHDDALRTVHEQELRLADLRGKAEHIRARAAEEFELDLQLRTYPEDEFVDFAALRDEIQGHRDKIKNLGNINFAAFEEYTTEKERLEFLSTQRQDLLEAEKTLLATIEEINATAQKKFLDTFALIRGNFIETFKSLFDPGDECDLKLEEGVDPLEARIEIVAKPRGKRPTSIDLLSGGEKTLTATALLFAIYLVKPSPFCILDEVDAPLDDANVDRFTRILRKFSDNTQFIVVTHNKRTMEAASALYGVTMEEEGVSKLVTVRFTKDSRVETAALASA
ncbi:MAG TPA: chromosome segregation protein SMC, partial [Bacteroidota bacterium]|nr:chromosome segregation protein SMC [Bacteroidota bacterium]